MTSAAGKGDAAAVANGLSALQTAGQAVRRGDCTESVGRRQGVEGWGQHDADSFSLSGQWAVSAPDPGVAAAC
jgi:hypothetical protein